MAGRVSILWLLLTAGGWLHVLLATRQNATEVVQASQTSTTSSTTSSSKILKDDLSPSERSSASGNNSRNVEVSSTPSPQAQILTSQGSARRTLPNFPGTMPNSPLGETIKNSLVLAATSASLNSLSSTGSSTVPVGHWQHNSYMYRWLTFYVKVGGWIMLAVILCGIISLVFTHIQAKRELRNAKDLPLLTRREQLIAQHKASWI